jgi:SAM-dependent methyltransferase
MVVSRHPAAVYREFFYPLNVFMHILTHEEGEVAALHYGLFERDDEPIAAAQERATELLLSRLPSPPARLLDAGCGLGTTLARLTQMGYDAEGITPDERQIAAVRARFGESVRAFCAPFESWAPGTRYDAVFFHESAQYIAADALFANARALTGNVIVLDEFATRAGESLHSLPEFLEAAERHGFTRVEELDVSAQAAPTMAYFAARIPRYREALVGELALTSEQIDELLRSGERYAARYRDGVFVYRLLRFAA